jgi:hypothetical protein
LDWRTSIGPCAVEGSAGAVPFRLQRGQPVLEDLIEIGHSILDQTVEALKLFVGVGHLPLQGGNAIAQSRGLLSPARGQRGEYRCQPSRLKQSLHEMIRHEGVELTHRDRAPLADCFALSRAN